MARIFLLSVDDPTALPSGTGFMVDSIDWADPGGTAKFLPLPDAVTALLFQSAPTDVMFPPGSLGAAVVSGVNGGVDGWYRITSFTHDGPVINEQGVIDEDVNLAWTIDFPVASVLGYTLTGPSGSVELPGDIYGVALTGANIGATTTWTLVGHLAFGDIEAELVYPFGFRVFHGRGGAADLTESTIEALSATLATEPPSEYIFTANVAGDSEAYLWISYPEEFGEMQRLRDRVTLLPVEFVDEGLVNVTNAFSVLRAYRIMRSVNALNGAMELEVY